MENQRASAASRGTTRSSTHASQARVFASRNVALQFSRGDLVVFLGMMCFALYSLLLRRWPAGMDRIGALAVQLGVATIVLFPLSAWEYGSGLRPSLTGASVAGVLYVALAASLLATFLYMQGVARVGPARAGLFIHLIPVYGAVLSALLLGEAIHPYHVAGLAVILAGIACSSRGTGARSVLVAVERRPAGFQQGLEVGEDARPAA